MRSIGNHIAILPTVDSSNNYAMQQVHAGLAEHGHAWLALEQTSGKGQRGKEWKTEPGQNILLSMALETRNLAIDQQFRLSAAVAVAVREFFASYAGGNVFVKWPNDIYWGDRKAGGILIENVIGSWAEKELQINDLLVGEKMANKEENTSLWKWAIVGMGVNINQTDFPPHLNNPVSLKQITQNTYDLMELTESLCISLEKYWRLLHSGGWQSILDLYNQHLFKKNQLVRLRKKTW